MSRGRHRLTLWARWKRRRKLPESFPIIGLLFAFLIGITVFGFVVTPSQEGSRPHVGVTPTLGTPDESGLVGS